MGAQPKNKITRVERGLRRKGNTPKLLKQISHSQVPAHKKKLGQRLINLFKTKAGEPAVE